MRKDSLFDTTDLQGMVLSANGLATLILSD